MIIHGDCLDEMKKMGDNSISGIVCDPPYGLHFMGKEFDKALPSLEIWKEALRICKPGAFLLAFGGTRTYHRLTCSVEDAGWEIRDCIFWNYGSGFPKSHNHFGIPGFGTALKPAVEPIIFASKPYEISHLLAIILLDLTNEVYKCQKLNYDVSDAELSLSDSLVLLDRVQKHSVQDDVKTYAWEKLSNVAFVARNVMSLNQELNEKINREKEFFAHINARENGKEEDLLVKKITSGKAESLFVAIQDIVIFALKENTKQNIGLLWKLILVGIYQGMSKFTTKMVISLITELRILKSCLSPSILKDTGNFSPDYEPIIMAMKPCNGTFKQNAEKWGQAGINIDGCRIETTDVLSFGSRELGDGIKYGKCTPSTEGIQNPKGRWPANVIFDEEAAKMLDEQSGISKPKSQREGIKGGSGFGYFDDDKTSSMKGIWPGDSGGGVSRFFYCAKTSSRERNEGLDGMPFLEGGIKNDSGRGFSESDPHKSIQYKNNHPTVKPLKLMRYLITLIMPPKDGILLDPFAGSGSTIIAAHQLGVKAIGIEKQAEYVEIAKKRLEYYKSFKDEKEPDLFDQAQVI